MTKKKYIWIIGIILIAGLLFFAISNSKVNKYALVNNFKEDITIYTSESCGCCSTYANYFKNKGNPNMDIVVQENSDSIKEKYGVPLNLKSCHTTIIKDYFIEGHVPLEAIEKLLKEKPDIAGIAISGMPEGSPGMPGTKKGDFVIYAVDYNGGYEEFIRI